MVYGDGTTDHSIRRFVERHLRFLRGDSLSARMFSTPVVAGLRPSQYVPGKAKGTRLMAPGPEAEREAIRHSVKRGTLYSIAKCLTQ